MLFDSDETQHSYHQAPVLLQVACQVLETHFAAAGVQLQLIDCEKLGGMWTAAIAIASDTHELVFEDIVARTNQAFLRADEVETVTIEDTEAGLMSVRVSDAKDFCQAH